MVKCWETSVRKQQTASPSLNWRLDNITPAVNRSHEKKHKNQQVFSVQPKPGDPTHTLLGVINTRWSVWSVAENSICINKGCAECLIFKFKTFKASVEFFESSCFVALSPSKNRIRWASRWDSTLSIKTFPQNCSTFVCSGLLNVVERAEFVR